MPIRVKCEGRIFGIKMFKSIGKTPSKSEREEFIKKTQYFDGLKFRNIHNLPLMVGVKSKRAKDTHPKNMLPVIKHKKIDAALKGELNIYWLGHSSVLLQLGEKNILIDPVLTKYASPFNFIGVKRFSDVPIEPCDLPYIDILMISHDHYDHLDYQTIMKIKNKVGYIIVPLGVESFIKSWGIEEDKIKSLSWWENIEIEGLCITATPAQHFSTRNPIKSNATWWCGFCIKDDKHTVYYSGDGGYSDTFKKIGERFDIDLAFMECGQYDEAWPSCHMFPEQTAKATFDVGAKWCIPVHWGTFCLCNSSWNDSIKRIVSEADNIGINVATPYIGECINYKNIEKHQERWWV